MEIRPAASGDLTALRSIYLESRRQAFAWLEGNAFRPEDFDRDTAGERIWVATRDTAVLGFVSAWEPENFVHHLFVHPAETGRGAGSALLAACLAGIGRPATLKCLERNRRAREFYEARGWRIVGAGDSPEGGYHLMQFD